MKVIMRSSPDRLLSIDGLRGVAILLVLGSHWFSDKSLIGMYPYGSNFLTLFKYGNMGVYLFFIISGFVIALTLDTSASVPQFIWRRFVRLWPALTLWGIFAFALL